MFDNEDAKKVPIVFMGTPDFAATLLKDLLDAQFHIVGVVTQPDRPIGRKQTLTSPPVKTMATAFNLPLLQPEKLDEAAFHTIASWKPELILVAAYGKILPKNILDLPRLGCLNVHASLLPRWRGASPIQNALIAGDSVTGITLMQMDEGMDTGAIISQRKLDILPDETALGLSERLSMIAAEALKETLPQWIEKKIKAVPQSTEGVTLCQLIEREDGQIFWSTTAEEIYNRYRGLTPWPGIFTFWKKGEDLIRLKLLSIGLQRLSPENDAPLGSVSEVGEKVGVKTAAGIIFLETIQAEGKDPLSAQDFIRGNPDFVGSTLL